MPSIANSCASQRRSGNLRDQPRPNQLQPSDSDDVAALEFGKQIHRSDVMPRDQALPVEQSSPARPPLDFTEAWIGPHRLPDRVLVEPQQPGTDAAAILEQVHGAITGGCNLARFARLRNVLSKLNKPSQPCAP